MEVGVAKGASRPDPGLIQRLHRASQVEVGVHGPEAAEVLSAEQQGRRPPHGAHVQPPEDQWEERTGSLRAGTGQCT